MRGKTQWNEKPHVNPMEDPNVVYISRLAPTEDQFLLEWTDAKNEGTYLLQWRPMFAGEPWHEREVQGYEACISGLTAWRDYEVRVARLNGAVGASRYVRPAPVVGTVINYLHPQDERYASSGRALCSPNLIKLPSGKLLASMDLYEGRGPQNLSLLFQSTDRGATWHYVCDLHPLFWGKMFWHRDRLYMLGCSTEFGDVVIGASDDEGKTWTAPVHLFSGSNTVGDGWEQSPMPVVKYNGRIYVSMEFAGRNVGWLPSVLSAEEGADLLDPGSWHASKPFCPLPGLMGTPGVSVECFVEGNLFVTPDGELCCMHRVDGEGFRILEGKAGVTKVNTEDPDAALQFSHFVSMPFGYHNKFMMRYDEVSGCYVAIGNLPTLDKCVKQRNVLALAYSKDAENWQLACRLIDYAGEQLWEVGYQYPSFLFDGDDILLQVRTATNGARNFHDANYSTFHVIPAFRKWLI